MIVAGLSRTPKVVARLVVLPIPTKSQPTADPANPVREERKPRRKARADAGKPRGKRTPKPSATPDARAFATTIPSSPVVFSPARLAEEKRQKEQGREVPVLADMAQPPEDLDALARSMAAQWGTVRVQ